MLRLGDIIIYNSDRVTVTAIYHSAGSIELTDGRGGKTNERLSDVYDELLKQERERADAAEKRWEKLKQKITDKYKYLERQFEAWEHDEDESKLWRTSKHEVLMILKDISDIERGEA